MKFIDMIIRVKKHLFCSFYFVDTLECKSFIPFRKSTNATIMPPIKSAIYMAVPLSKITATRAVETQTSTMLFVKYKVFCAFKTVFFVLE